MHDLYLLCGFVGGFVAGYFLTKALIRLLRRRR